VKGIQLPLGVQIRETSSFTTFHAGPNAETVAALRHLGTPAAPPLVLIFGPRGSGKTHLLQALTHDQAERRSCAYLPLRELYASPEALTGFESADLVCVDDVDAVSDDAERALPLLRLLDGVRAHGGCCALSAPAPPERLGVRLPDLATRLAAAAVYGLKPLNDMDREQLLRERARGRGLDLAPDAARLLLSRLPRDAGSLLGALDSLDRAALTAQRKLTLPFVQQWLSEQP
jgi:DnaA family protein